MGTPKMIKPPTNILSPSDDAFKRFVLKSESRQSSLHMSEWTSRERERGVITS